MASSIAPANEIVPVCDSVPTDHVPFSFWFCRPIDEKKIEEFKIKKEKFFAKADKLTKKAKVARTLKYFCSILNEFDKLEDKYRLVLGSTFLAVPMFYIPGYDPFGTERKIILSYFDKFIPDWYKIPVDSKLESLFENNIRYDYFLKFEKLYNKKNTMTFEEFCKTIRMYTDNEKDMMDLFESKCSHSLIFEIIKFSKNCVCHFNDIIGYSKKMCMYVEQKIQKQIV